MFTEDDFIKVPNPKRKKLFKQRLGFWLLALLGIGIVVTLYCIKKCARNEMSDNQVVIVDDTMKRQTDVDVVKDSLVILDSITTNPTKEEAEEAKAVDVRPKGEFVPAERTKDVDVHLMAKRVIRGDFGNGDDRKRMLQNNYQVIQHQVNLNYRNGDLNW